MYKLKKIKLNLEQYNVVRDVLNLSLIDNSIKIKLNIKQYDILKKILKLPHSDILYLNENEEIMKDYCVVSYLDLREYNENDGFQIDKIQMKLSIKEYNGLKDILKSSQKIDLSEYDFDYKTLKSNIEFIKYNNDYFITGDIDNLLNLREVIEDYFLMNGFKNDEPTEEGLLYEDLIDLLYF